MSPSKKCAGVIGIIRGMLKVLFWKSLLEIRENDKKIVRKKIEKKGKIKQLLPWHPCVYAC